MLPYIKESGEKVQGHTKNAPHDGKALPRHRDQYVTLPFEVLEGDLMIGLFGDQRVVVIGAANSAVKIAHELAQVSSVVLATRESIRFFPQKILGVDFHAWLKWTGMEMTRWLNDKVPLCWMMAPIVEQ